MPSHYGHKGMEDIYAEDTDRYHDFDEAVKAAEHLEGEEKVDALSDAAKKRELGNKMLQSIGLETGVGLAADILLPSPDPISRGLNFGIGYGTNVIAQKLRGQTFSHGEAVAAGGFQAIPFGTAAKGLKGIIRAGAKGAAGAVVGEQVRVGIDEQRPLTFTELVQSGAFGGAFGTVFKGGGEVISTVKKADLGKRLLEQVNPGGTILATSGTGLDQGDLSLSKRLANADLSQVPDDALDINIRRTKISNPDFYQKQRDRMTQWGMEDGVFDYFQFRHLKETGQKGPTPSRAFAEFFQSIREYAENYKGVVKYKRPEFEARWKDFLKARDIDPNAIQLHHIDLLQDSMGLYHGVEFDSDEWWEITSTLLKANVRPGTTNWSRLKGEDNPNLRYVLGYSGQEDMPHGVAHKLYRDELDAKGFFDNEEILKMSINPEYRIEKVKKFAKIVNRSEDILEQAMKTFEALNPKGDMDYTATVNFLSTLNKDGLLPTKIIDGKYQVPQMKQLILDIRREMDNLPPTIRVDSETFEYWLLNKLLDYYGGANPNLIYGVKRRIKKKFKPKN